MLTARSYSSDRSDCWAADTEPLLWENLALRQLPAALTRTRERTQFRPADRPFWILLANASRDWRTALMVVQPETVGVVCENSAVAAEMSVLVAAVDVAGSDG